MAFKKCDACGGVGWVGNGRSSIFTPEDRFSSKVRKTRSCWIWTSTTNKAGYGIFYLGRKHRIRAHRWAYQNKYGPIPLGKFVCHTCDNRLCVNVKHLFLGTVLENTRDMVRKGRHASVKSTDYLTRGSRQWASKLKEEDIPVIRRLISERVPQTHIAKQYGVSVNAILMIKQNKTWVHVK